MLKLEHMHYRIFNLEGTKLVIWFNNFTGTKMGSQRDEIACSMKCKDPDLEPRFSDLKPWCFLCSVTLGIAI